MAAFYNENNLYAAQWLRNLIDVGLIAPGIVDERDIRDISPNELTDYTQCHFFAGVGVWSLALRQAGWSDTRPVWTGSCPCQPFSAAGKGEGFTDERHLWPDWHHLIAECRPATIFGEQVASKDGLNWFDLVQADMEGTGYAIGAADLCAASVGAPHIRQRLWFVAERLGNAYDSRPQGYRRFGQVYGSKRRESSERHGAAPSVFGGVANGDNQRCKQESGFGPARLQRKALQQTKQLKEPSNFGTVPNSVSDADNLGHERRQSSQTYPTNGLWKDADWLGCRDGKWRPVESGTFPLAYGVAARMGRLRAYGNAIVAPAAQAFIEAYLDCSPATDREKQNMQIKDLSDNAIKFWFCYFQSPDSTLRFGGDHAEMEITPTGREALDQLLAVRAVKSTEPDDQWPGREHYGATKIDLWEVAIARGGGTPEKAFAWLSEGEFAPFRKKAAR